MDTADLLEPLTTDQQRTVLHHFIGSLNAIIRSEISTPTEKASARMALAELESSIFCIANK